MAPKECNLDADIESGQISDEGKRALLTRTNSGLRVQGPQEPNGCVPKSGNPSFGNVTIVIDKNPGLIEYRDLLNFLEKGFSKEKPSSTRKFKPPRLPKGPFLSHSDMRLVKELYELAIMKRARIERVKALKMMKAAKGPSSSSRRSATAMAFTILFFFVMVFQGMVV